MSRPDAGALPRGARVSPRGEAPRLVLAAIAGALWPPLVLTLPKWPPVNWVPNLDMDWRLAVLLIGALAVPVGIWLMRREHRKGAGPQTRLGVVWRFILYGGLLAAAVQTVVALVASVAGWIGSEDVRQAAGATETTLLIYGVGLLPISVMVGVSYALWAGLCVAFIAYRAQPEVRDRLGVMGDAAR